MHPSTFEYLMPSENQKKSMAVVRHASKDYSDILVREIPEGPDKTYLLRKFREVAMWANVAITRQPDGAPRED